MEIRESSETFKYADDTFRGTDAPGRASGRWEMSALAVELGGNDDAGTSGGWKSRFTLKEEESLVLTFRVRVRHDGPAERDDLSLVMISVDGHLRGVGTRNYAVRVTGGDESGWQTVVVDIGPVSAGRHTLTVGGFSSGSDETKDRTKILFDDVTLSDKPPIGRFEARVLKLVNDIREDRGLDPLANDHRLNLAAEDWSRTMAKRDIFEHSKGPSQVERQGYEWIAWSENIAIGYDSPKAVVKNWMQSADHRANILDPDYEELGIGYYYLRDDGGRVPAYHYWTQEFGTERDILI